MLYGFSKAGISAIDRGVTIATDNNQYKNISYIEILTLGKIKQMSHTEDTTNKKN